MREKQPDESLPVTSPTLGNGTWHVYASQSLRFATDEITVFVAHVGNDGRRVLQPVELALNAEVASANTEDDATAPLVLPKELAIALFEALSFALTGKDGVYAQIRTLKRELNQANTRLDHLIIGIGKGLSRG